QICTRILLAGGNSLIIQPVEGSIYRSCIIPLRKGDILLIGDPRALIIIDIIISPQRYFFAIPVFRGLAFSFRSPALTRLWIKNSFRALAKVILHFGLGKYGRNTKS